ncbi:MAG TPA: hypothetical protein VGH38_14395 [Bryobacteraceae bacterium]
MGPPREAARFGEALARGHRVTGGSTVTVSAALSDVAPDGGLTVTLASSNSSIVAATTLTVPAARFGGHRLRPPLGAARSGPPGLKLRRQTRAYEVAEPPRCFFCPPGFGADE